MLDHSSHILIRKHLNELPNGAAVTSNRSSREPLVKELQSRYGPYAFEAGHMRPAIVLDDYCACHENHWLLLSNLVSDLN